MVAITPGIIVIITVITMIYFKGFVTLPTKVRCFFFFSSFKLESHIDLAHSFHPVASVSVPSLQSS